MIRDFCIKASPEDLFPADILKMVIKVALLCLTQLVNKSLSEESLERLKLSVLDLLLKKAGLNADTKKNYRPVNNLFLFSKLSEK